MESLKELIDRRNKLVHDARAILDREKDGNRLSADQTAKADELLDQAGQLDAEIEERKKGEGRKQRLAELEGRLADPPARQVPPSSPGANPPARSGDGAALSLPWRGRELTFRPGTPQALRGQDGYRNNFLRYLMGGDGEQLGLQVSKDTQGGYLASVQTSMELIKFLDNEVFLRNLCTVLPPLADAVSIGIPSWDTDPNDADWTAEVPASDISEDTAAAIGKRELMPHLLTKLIKISQKMLRVSTIDLEGLVVQRLGYKFAITAEQAYMTGSGLQRPLGIFTASNDGIPTTRDTTATNTTSFVADDLINTLYSLKEAYQRNATWIIHRDGIKMCRKLKDGQGQYLWQAGLQGQPGTILDRPYAMSEYAPSTFTTGQYVAAVGDWKAGYWIVDGIGLEIQRLNELFTLKNQVGLLGRMESDGMPVLAEATARLKLA